MVLEFLARAWLVFLLSLVLSAALFPVVLAGYWAYRELAKRYPRTPKLLFAAVCTFLGVLLVVALAEIYFTAFASAL